MGRYQPNTHLPTERFRPPPSGVVLGIIVDAFGLRDPDEPLLSSKTAQRLFGGERISDGKRQELLEAIARALVEVGIHLPPEPNADGVDAATLMREFLESHARAWDGLRGLLSGQSCPVGTSEAPWVVFAYLRLAAIDLAVRWVAARLLDEAPAPSDGDWAWTEPRGACQLLKSWLADERVHLTPEGLARELGKNRKTVYGWTGGGSTPDTVSQASIADFFAEKLERDRDALARQLRLHYGLVAVWGHAQQALSMPALPKPERDAFASFIREGFVRLVSMGWQELEPYVRPSVIERPGGPPREALYELVRYGSRGGAASQWLVNRWWTNERDPLWATDLRAVGGSWLNRLQQCTRHISPLSDPSAVDQIKRELTSQGVPENFLSKSMLHQFMWMAQADQSVDSMTPAQRKQWDGMEFLVIPSDDAQKSRTRMTQFDECLTHHKYDAALEHGLRAVELTPEDPEVLFRVGALLAQRAYEWRFAGWQRDIEAALELLRKSTSVDPTWDRPWVEIAIVLENAGDWAAARMWSESIPDDVHVTPHLLKVRGFQQLMTGHFEDAKKTLEALIELMPEHADGHDGLAYCCFRLGDKKAGRRHAKNAAHLGRTTVQEWLDAGGDPMAPYRGFVPSADNP